MTSFFVGCFAFGLLFTVVTFLLGGLGGTQSHGAAHGLFSGLTGSHASTHAQGHSANRFRHSVSAR